MCSHFLRPVDFCLLLLAAFVTFGCSDGGSQPETSQPVKVNQSNAAPKKSEPSPVDIRISAVGDDPTIVEVTVTVPNAVDWSTIDLNADETLKRAFMLFRRYGADEKGSHTDSPQPILGKYDVDGKRLRFRPAFALIRGETYAARFEPAQLLGQTQGRVSHSADYQVPMLSAPKPRVTAIYPSGNIVPANHLKFYIHFSEPMQRDGIFEYFRLIDLSTSQPVPRPFRHVELWSKDSKQLTLWFHPGRQKQGVNLNVEIGPVLKAEGEYRLEIDGEWMSERGVALGKPFEKLLRAAPVDHQQPKPATWILSSPMAETTIALTCDFHEPLDWALLHSEITVTTATGERVPGHVELGYGELSWAFRPEQPWQPGKYRLVVGSLLEDLAGNSVGRPFEVDIAKTEAQSADEPKPVNIDFEVFSPGE